MLWRLAGPDPDRYQRLLVSPLRDCCAAYHEKLYAEAARDYEVKRLMWASGAEFNGSKKPPAPDAILREGT